MKTALALVSFTVAIFLGCDEGDGASTGPSTNSGSGRIEAGLLGTWVRNPAPSMPDTLIFSETLYRTPYLSGVGTQFSAKDGLVKGGPDNRTVGEYIRVGDTLYFDGLLGAEPDGVDTSTARRYLKLQ
jgi:hypothetical protein